jgi:Na+/melibiose symporter-like transporter
MDHEQYMASFTGTPLDSETTKAAKALTLALDIRKFEIELYWKRATYFWTFIAAAFAAYAIVYSRADSKDDPWLLLVFSCLGFLFSSAWYLVNRGSKFWQNN